MINTLQQQQTVQLKVVFRGRLEFGSQRAYDMVLKHWNSRVENYFKSDVLFTAEQVFTEEDYALTVPQQTLMSSQKRWRSTTASAWKSCLPTACASKPRSPAMAGRLPI